VKRQGTHETEAGCAASYRATATATAAPPSTPMTDLPRPGVTHVRAQRLRKKLPSSRSNMATFRRSVRLHMLQPQDARSSRARSSGTSVIRWSVAPSFGLPMGSVAHRHGEGALTAPKASRQQVSPRTPSAVAECGRRPSFAGATMTYTGRSV
jgi:hypothetical protein